MTRRAFMRRAKQLDAILSDAVLYRRLSPPYVSRNLLYIFICGRTWHSKNDMMISSSENIASFISFLCIESLHDTFSLLDWHAKSQYLENGSRQNRAGSVLLAGAANTILLAGA